MKIDKIKKNLDELSDLGIAEVDFGEGGEASLHPDLLEAVEYAYEECDLTPNLTTNLMVPLSKELIRSLSKYLGSIVTSIDNYHFPMFSMNGIPENISINIQKLRKYNFYPSVNYVYDLNDSNRVKNDIEWLYNYGFKKITLLRLFGKHDKVDVNNTNYHIVNLIDFISKLEIDISFGACDPILDHPQVAIALKHSGFLPGARCTAGKDFLFLDIDGNVRACGHCPKSQAIKSSSINNSLKLLKDIVEADRIKNILFCPYKNTNERR